MVYDRHNAEKLCCKCHKKLRYNKTSAYCLECSKLYYLNVGKAKKYYRSNHYKTVSKEHIHKRKIQLILQKGGKCEICGYNRNYAALCFHHVNGRDGKQHSKKKPGILNYENPNRKNFDLTKVILVCHNCHAEIHYPDMKFPSNV